MIPQGSTTCGIFLWRKVDIVIKSSVSLVSGLTEGLISIADRVSKIDAVVYAANTDVEVQSKCNQGYTIAKNITCSFSNAVKEDAQHILDVATEFQDVDSKWKREYENASR